MIQVFKKLVLVAFIGSMAIYLSACTQDVVDHDLEVVNGTETYEGMYTGTLEDGKPIGQAKYVVKIDDTSNWVYNGPFTEGSFSGEGTVENFPCKVKIGVKNDDGVYSGVVKDGVIDGKGDYNSSLGWHYVGSFENGEIKGEGTIENYSYPLLYENQTLEGTYNGAVLDGIPNGEGKIEVKAGDVELSYDGNWTDGKLSGEGNLKSNSYTVPFTDTTRTGEYEGATLDGKASGEGVFTATNSNGDKYTYTGEFLNGTFDGIGTIDFESDDITDFTGHFTKGENTPTQSELLKYIGTVKDFVSYGVSDTSVKFIDAHNDLFMAESEDALEAFINSEVTLNELYKTPNEHNDEIIKVSTKKIIQIRQEDIYKNTITWFIVEDTSGNRMFVICNGKLPEVNKNDKVTVYGLPIDLCSYKNSFNGSVSAFVIYGAVVKK